MHDDQKTADAISESGEVLLAEVESMLDALRKQMPTAEELQWLKERKLDDERAAWLWQQIRKHAPWVGVVAAMIGGGLAWLVNNSVHVTSK